MKTLEMVDYIGKNYGPKLCSLWERWQDEKEYEDFNDYVDHFASLVPEVVGGSKKPFGFILKVDDGTGLVNMSIRLTKGNRLSLCYVECDKITYPLRKKH